MKACTMCGKGTDNIVREPNICKDLPLCDDCKKQFEKCTVCGGHYYPDEMKNGKCSNCQEEE